MQGYTLAAAAGAPLVAIVHGIRDDQLDAATPCTEYTVRALVNHLRYWGPSLEGAARKELVTPPAAAEPDVDLAGPGWAGELEAQVSRLVKEWSEPDAWTGTTHLGGPTPLPAAMIGGMVLGELVVHGWDLARATGQYPHWDGQLLDFLSEELARTAEQGRAMGVYADPVPVPDGASALDRTLGLTGRDPSWSPARATG